MLHAQPAINESAQCICDTSFTWDGTICSIDCTLLNNTAGAESFDTCKCVNTFEWNSTALKCQQAIGVTYYYYNGYWYGYRHGRTGWIIAVSIVGGIFLLLILGLLLSLCICPQKFTSRSARRYPTRAYPQQPYASPYGIYNYPQAPPHYPPMQNPYIGQYPAAATPMQPVNQMVPPPIPPMQVQQAANNALSYPAIGSQLYGPSAIRGSVIPGSRIQV